MARRIQDEGLKGKLTRTNSQVVDKSENEKHGSDSPRDALVVGLESETTGDDHKDEESNLAVEVERATADLAEKEPGAKSTDETHGELTNREVESLFSGKTGLGVKVRGKTHERTTAEDLDEPDDAGNLGTATVGALEAVPVRATLGSSLLELVGVDHHLNSLVSLVVGELAVVGSKATKRVPGVLETVLTNQPPGRLGSEPASDEDRNGPDPLDGVRNLVSPVVGAGDGGTEDTRGDELTNDPASVDPGGEERTKSNGSDFGGVRGGEGLENTPGKTLKNLADEKDGEVRSEEGDEDETGHEDEGDEDGLAVTEALRSDTGELETEDGTDLGTVGETRLPRSGNLALASGVAVTVLLGEGGLGEKVTEKERVVTLHDDGEGEDDGEEDGVGVGPESLAQAHLLLSLSSLVSIVNESIVVLDVGGDGGSCLGVDAGDVLTLDETHCV